MVKVAKSRVADRNIGLPSFHLCYSLEVALNRLAIGGICSEKKNRHVLWGDASPSSPLWIRPWPTDFVEELKTEHVESSRVVSGGMYSVLTRRQS